MNERKFKKNCFRVLFKNTNMNTDSCKITAYQVKDLAKDLAHFENIPVVEALSRMGLNEDLSSIHLGEIESVKKLGILI